MQNDVEAVIYQDIPNNKLQGKSLENWSRLDIKVAVVFALILFAIWQWTNPGWTVVFLFLSGVLLWRSGKALGRLYYEISRGIRGSIRQSVTGGVLWQAERPEGRFKQLMLRLLGRGTPLALGEVSARINDEVYRYGIIESLDRDRPYVYLPILASGASFNNRDVNGMHRAVQELTRITNAALVQTHLRAGISYVRIHAPLDDTRIISYLRQNSDPVTARLELFDLSDDDRERAEWLRSVGDSIVPTLRQHGAETPYGLILITIRRGREWHRAGKGKLTDTQLLDLPIIELGRSLVESLHSSPLLDMKDVHCPNLPELALIVRSSWDTVGLEQYQLERLNGTIPITNEQVDVVRQQPDGEQLLNKLLRPWPEVEITTPPKTKCLVMDGNYLSAMRIVEMPKQLRVDQAIELHTIMRAGQWTRQAFVGESVSGQAETRNLIVKRSALINFERTFFAGRVVASPNIGRKQRSMADETEMVSAETIAQHFNGLWVSVASSHEELITTQKTVSAALKARGFNVSFIEDADFLHDAVISGTLGINRL